MPVSRASASLTHGLRGAPPLYICRQCRSQATRHLQARAASSSAPAANHERNWTNRVSEGLRKRIWGTDTPPGQKDPYRKEQPAVELLPPNDDYASEEPVPADVVRTKKARRRAEARPEVAVDDSNYVPATNWDGLMAIGGPTGWWEEGFDQEHQFQGFISPDLITSAAELEKIIRKALVEVHLMRLKGKPLDRAISADRTPEKRIRFLENYGSSLERAFFARSAEGQSAVLDVAAEEAMQDDGLDVAEEEGATTDVSVAEPMSIAGILQETLSTSSPTDAWRDASISDLQVKFAVLKRVTQLSGRRIRDHAIANLATGKDLFDLLVKKPTPKKLAQILTVHEALTQLPNVEIKERRYTPIDREKEVGRWKVIEKELVRKGLPVTGVEIPGRYD